jgi:hypothetical protein
MDMASGTLSSREVGGTTYGYFKGKCCPFETIALAWRAEDLQTSPGSGAFVPIQQIALDSTPILNQTTLQIPYTLSEVPRTLHQHELAAMMSTKFQDHQLQVFVCLLGILSYYERGYRDEEDAINARKCAVGLIVLRATDRMVGPWWARLGVCIWDLPLADDGRTVVPDPGLLTGDADDWLPFEGIFG